VDKNAVFQHSLVVHIVTAVLMLCNLSTFTYTSLASWLGHSMDHVPI